MEAAGEVSSALVTCLTAADLHLMLHVQLVPDQCVRVESSIAVMQQFLEMNMLSSVSQLQPGMLVLVRSGSGEQPGQVRWLRAAVLEIGRPGTTTVHVQFVDYGSCETVLVDNMCSGHWPHLTALMSIAPAARQFTLADVVFSSRDHVISAVKYLENAVLGKMVSVQILASRFPASSQSAEVGQLRVRTVPDNQSLADQLVTLALAQPAPLLINLRQPPPNCAVGFMQRAPLTVARHPYYGEGQPFSAGFDQQVRYPPPSVQPEPMAARVGDFGPPSVMQGCELRVSVCHYTDSPAKFCVRSGEDQAALHRLLAEIREYSDATGALGRPLAAPQTTGLGAACLAPSQRAPADIAATQLLRGVVIQVDSAGPGTVKVYWIDLGFDEVCSVSSLCAMPLRLASTPMLVHRVSLAGLNRFRAACPSSSVQQLFHDLTANRPLTARFVNDQPPFYVELFDSGVSVLELLVRHGAYIAREDGAYAGRDAGVGVAESSDWQCLQDPASTFSSVGSTFAVELASVTALDRLHLRLSSCSGGLYRLQRALAELLTAKPEPLTPTTALENTVCVVNTKEGVARRGRVINCGRRDVKVHLIDIGLSQLLPLSSTYALTSKLAEVPPQAVTCLLHGLEKQHGTVELLRYLESLLAQPASITCSVTALSANQLPVVQLTAIGGAGGATCDINAALSARLRPDPVPSEPAVDITPRELEIGSVVSLVITHVDSASRFFGQLADIDCDALYKLEQMMNTAYIDIQPGRRLRAPSVGKFCISMYMDNYYRGKITSVEDSSVTVEYIDYGNSEVKNADQVYKIVPEIAKPPRFGVYCSLIGGSKLQPEQFSDAVLNETIDFIVHTRHGEQYRVKLAPVSNNEALFEKLIKIGYKGVAYMSPKKPVIERRLSEVLTDQPVNGDAVLTLTTQTLPIGVYKDVSVVYVDSPSKFFVQLRDLRSELVTVQQRLCERRESGGFQIRPQQLVAVSQGGSDGWQRARVLAAPANGNVRVQFVDVGNVRSVCVSRVPRLLTPDETTLPAQAVLCCVRGEECGRVWTDVEVERFRERMLQQRVLLCVHELTDDGVAMVELAQAKSLQAVTAEPPSPPHRLPSRSDQDTNWRKPEVVRPVSGRESGPWRKERQSSASGGAQAGPGRMRMDDPDEFAMFSNRDDAGADSSRQNGVDWRAPRHVVPAAEKQSFSSAKQASSAEKPPLSAKAESSPACPIVPPHDSRIVWSSLPVGETLSATPSWVTSLARFYVQPGEGERLQLFRQLMKQIQLFYGRLGGDEGGARETDIRLEMPVVLQWDDSVWYRGVVKKLDGDDVWVIFADYGNGTVIHRSKLKRIKPEMCSQPSFAYRCRFANLEPIGGTWKELDQCSMSKYFSQSFKVVSMGEAEGCSLVDVMCGEQSSRDLLIADGLAFSSDLTNVTITSIGEFSTFSRGFGRGERVSAFVSFVSSPGQFYLQLTEHHTLLEQLEADIEAHVQTDSQLCSDVSVGMACLAPFEDVHYRCNVLSLEAETASVYFVDYGNREVVQKSELLICPAVLRNAPVYALPCSVTGILSVHSTDAEQLFTKLCSEQEVEVAVDSIGSDSLLVSDILIHNQSITKQLSQQQSVTEPPASSLAAVESPPVVAESICETVGQAGEWDCVATEAAEETIQPVLADYREAMTSHVVDPDCFYVQFSSDLQLLDNIIEQLELFDRSENCRLEQQFCVGDAVVAPFSEDGSLYRGRILQLSYDSPSADSADSVVENGSADTADCVVENGNADTVDSVVENSSADTADSVVENGSADTADSVVENGSADTADSVVENGSADTADSAVENGSADTADSVVENVRADIGEVCDVVGETASGDGLSSQSSLMESNVETTTPAEVVAGGSGEREDELVGHVYSSAPAHVTVPLDDTSCQWEEASTRDTVDDGQAERNDGGFSGGAANTEENSVSEHEEWNQSANTEQSEHRADAGKCSVCSVTSDRSSMMNVNVKFNSDDTETDHFEDAVTDTCDNNSVSTETYIDAEISSGKADETDGVGSHSLDVVEADVDAEADTGSGIGVVGDAENVSYLEDPDVDTRRDVDINDDVKKDGTVKDDIEKDGTVEDDIEKDCTVKDDIEKVGSVKDDVEKDGTVKDDIEKDGSVKDDIEKDGTVKDDIEKDGSVKDDTETDGTVKDAIEKDGSVKDDTETDGTVKDDIEKDGTVKDDIEKDGSVKDDIEKDGTVNDDIEKDGSVKDDTETDGTVKDGTVKDDVDKDCCVKDDIEKGGSVKDDVDKDGTVKDDVDKDSTVKDDVDKDGIVKYDIEKDGTVKQDVEKGCCVKDDTMNDVDVNTRRNLGAVLDTGNDNSEMTAGDGTSNEIHTENNSNTKIDRGGDSDGGLCGGVDAIITAENAPISESLTDSCAIRTDKDSDGVIDVDVVDTKVDKECETVNISLESERQATCVDTKQGNLVSATSNTGARKMALVQFFDYGNSELMPVSLLSHLPNSLHELAPPLAHRCRLEVGPASSQWSSGAIDRLTELLEPGDAQLQLRGAVDRQVPDDVDCAWLVKVRNGQHGDIAEVLLAEGWAIESPHGPDPFPAQSPAEQDGGVVTAATWAESAWCRVGTGDIVSVRVFLAVAAHPTDFLLLHCDDGAGEGGWQLRCRLPVITSHESGYWPAEAKLLFTQLLNDAQCVRAELLEPPQDDQTTVCRVNLYSGETDVAFELVGAGFGRAETAAKCIASEQQASVATDVVSCSRTDLQGETTVDVLVVHIESLSHFYIQRQSDYAVLEDLQERLEEIAGKTCTTTEVPPIDSVCLARSPDDEVWYRGQVLSATDYDVFVQFIDYGNCVDVPLTAVITDVDAAVWRLPALALRCRLPAKPLSQGGDCEVWDAGAVSVFAEIATSADNCFTARLLLLPARRVTSSICDSYQWLADLRTVQYRAVVDLLREADVQLAEWWPSDSRDVNWPQEVSSSVLTSTAGQSVDVHSPSTVERRRSRGRLSPEDKIVPGHLTHSLIVENDTSTSPSKVDPSPSTNADPCEAVIESHANADGVLSLSALAQQAITDMNALDQVEGVLSAELENADVWTYDEAGLENADLQTRDHAELENTDVQTHDRAVLENTDVQTQDRAEIENADVQTQDRVEVENADVQTQDRAEIENADVQTQDRAEIENADVQTQDRAEIENTGVQTQDQTEIENVNVQTQDQAEIENDDVQKQDQAELENTDVQTQDQAELENTDVQTQDQTEIENADVQTQDQAEIENTDVLTQDHAEIENADVQTQDQAEIENADVQTQGYAELENTDVQTQDRAEIENADVLTHDRAEGVESSVPEIADVQTHNQAEIKTADVQTHDRAGGVELSELEKADVQTKYQADGVESSELENSDQRCHAERISIAPPTLDGKTLSDHIVNHDRVLADSQMRILEAEKHALADISDLNGHCEVMEPMLQLYAAKCVDDNHHGDLQLFEERHVSLSEAGDTSFESRAPVSTSSHCDKLSIAEGDLYGTRVDIIHEEIVSEHGESSTSDGTKVTIDE